MRHLNEYIYDVAEDKVLNEGLISWLKAFIKKIKSNQLNLIHNGKVNMLKMDTNKLKYQKDPAPLNDLINDQYVQEIWKNNKIGFPESYKVAQNIKRISPDLNDVKSNPFVYTFYYNGENTYYAGIIIYEKEIQYIENYMHIVSIETNLVVDNPSEVQKAMFDQFKKMLNTNKMSIEGFTAKNSHEKMKGILANLKFKEAEDLEEIYKLEI